MGFAEIVEPGSHVKTRLLREQVEFQVHGGQPQTKFFIGKDIAMKLDWDGTTRVRIHHGSGPDFGWIRMVPDKKGLRVGRYGKNAFAVQLGKKKYFDIPKDPAIQIREVCNVKVNKDKTLDIEIPPSVVSHMSKSLKHKLKKE